MPGKLLPDSNICSMGGAALFAVCQILKCPIGDYTRESMPFLIAVSAVTLLLVFVPEIVLLVPNLIFGKD